MGVRPAAGRRTVGRRRPGAAGRWLENFASRHGAVRPTAGLILTAADGATAELHAPPGAPGAPATWRSWSGRRGAPRRLGLLLARKGAVAVGVADGPELVVSKVDTHYVQGRTAAGGWSQQRFARRRDNQAKAAAADGAEHRRAACCFRRYAR